MLLLKHGRALIFHVKDHGVRIVPEMQAAHVFARCGSVVRVDRLLAVVILLLHFVQLVRQTIVLIFKGHGLRLNFRFAIVRLKSLLFLVAGDLVLRLGEDLPTIVALLVAVGAALAQLLRQLVFLLELGGEFGLRVGAV